MTDPTPPDLMPYEDWKADQDEGAQAAHTDASLAPEDRMTPDAIADQGPAFLDGYNGHWTSLQNAGVVQ